jgi:putative isomerase
VIKSLRVEGLGEGTNLSIMKTKLAILLLSVCFSISMTAQYKPKPLSENYINLKKNLTKGWNTWNTNSVLSHVLMPEAFAINLCLKSKIGWSAQYLNTSFLAYWKPERLKLETHADDGSFTSLEIEYDGVKLRVESAHDGDDELILLTPLKLENTVMNLVIETGILWNRQGCIKKTGDQITAELSGKTITVNTTAEIVTDNLIVSNSPYMVTTITDQIFGVYTGKKRSVDEIKNIIKHAREKEEMKSARYGDLSECFKAMQTILAWNVIYEPEKDRVVSPVSRCWNYNWGGYILFDWDTYFASYMYSMYNKDLSFANAIEITKSITPGGFIPNGAGSYGWQSIDRSQPPVGSFIIREIYRKYPEKWFLEEVYDELITWNRWWIKKRVNKGYLCWGSNKCDNADPKFQTDMNTMKAAKWESGLDNSPMYDSIEFTKETGMMELADVGLMSFYIMDCDALSDIASILGKKDDVKELEKREEEFKKKLQTLWSENDGIYLNKRTDNGQLSKRLSPTNFYPMIAEAPSQKQAERMMKEHYFNPKEFYGEFVMPSIARNDPAFPDNDYWRGRIWAPMNFLVYLGMINYKVDDARIDLVKRSRALLMKSWMDGNRVFENYNSVNGEGDDVKSADWFYHWGALLGFMSFIETGYVEKPH